MVAGSRLRSTPHVPFVCNQSWVSRSRIATSALITPSLSWALPVKVTGVLVTIALLAGAV